MGFGELPGFSITDWSGSVPTWRVASHAVPHDSFLREAAFVVGSIRPPMARGYLNCQSGAHNADVAGSDGSNSTVAPLSRVYSLPV